MQKADQVEYMAYSPATRHVRTPQHTIQHMAMNPKLNYGVQQFQPT